METDVLNIGLPKWPALVVKGDAVTREQAAEILVRTNRWRFFTNDRAWKREVYDIAGIKCSADIWAGEDPQSLKAFVRAMGVLDLNYLDNEQIAQGYALLCVSYPQADCLIRANVEEELI